MNANAPENQMIYNKIIKTKEAVKMVKCSLCIDLLYLEIGEHGPIFSDTEKLLAGMELDIKQWNSGTGQEETMRD